MYKKEKECSKKNSSNSHYWGWIIICSVIFVVEYITLSNNSLMTRFHEFQLLLIWAVAQYGSYKKYGIFNIYTLILISIFLFSIGAVAHFFISGDDIRQLLNKGFGDFYFTDHVMQESLFVYSVFIFYSYVACLKVYTQPIMRNKNLENTLNIYSYFRMGKWLMWAFLWIEIYKGYLYFSSFSLDRVMIFLYGNMSNPVPTWVRLLATFFEVGYFFIIASYPSKNDFKKYSMLFFVTLIPEILLGNRGMFGAFLLFYFWYYNKYYNAKVFKIKYIAVFGVLMLVVFQLMQYYRDGTLASSSISFTSFLVGQGVSFYILPLYIVYGSSMQYYSYPFVFYNIIGGFSGYTGQSLESLQHKCGVGHQLMYTVSPNYYLAGGSFGSSNVVELYDLGMIGVVVGAIFFPYMLRFVEIKMNGSIFWRFASYVLITHFVLSPRGSYFPQLYSLLKLYLFFMFCLFIYRLLGGKINGIKS